MKTNKMNFVRRFGLLFMLGAVMLSSCGQEEEITTSPRDGDVKTPIHKIEVPQASTGRKGDEVLKEMQAFSDALHRTSPGNGSEKISNAALAEFSVPPPYYSSNSGSVYKNINFTGQSNTYDFLNFGNRAPEHTTQWIAMDLSGVIGWTDVGRSLAGGGSVTFELAGVGQSVTLHFQIDPAAANGVRPITVTPTSSASLIRNDVVPSPMPYNGGPITMIIHANEFGYLWLRLTQNGLIKYDQLYRFNYAPNLNNANGGSVSMSGFGIAGGPYVPYSVFYAESRYSGYCGWFKE